ncbi:hypothetical protein RhiirA4_452241 [Rhizophagus irregularis]|uniref:Uncharacterized protein n=1 Tax=Rhizophagus irregularis TaxID=588596 RepID=A0A2I1FXJ0_9GLOM|nr:hypothetical protein RhiirA4_452241 [Rhizophagus irregularis]
MILLKSKDSRELKSAFTHFPTQLLSLPLVTPSTNLTIEVQPYKFILHSTQNGLPRIIKDGNTTRLVQRSQLSTVEVFQDSQGIHRFLSPIVWFSDELTNTLQQILPTFQSAIHSINNVLQHKNAWWCRWLNHNNNLLLFKIYLLITEKDYNNSGDVGNNRADELAKLSLDLDNFYDNRFTHSSNEFRFIPQYNCILGTTVFGLDSNLI